MPSNHTHTHKLSCLLMIPFFFFPLRFLGLKVMGINDVPCKLVSFLTQRVGEPGYMQTIAK